MFEAELGACGGDDVFDGEAELGLQHLQRRRRAGALADVLTEGGFTDVRVREVQTPMQVQTFDEWWNVVPSLAGPIAPVLASLPTELTTAIRTEPRLRWRSFTPAAVTSCLD